MAPYVIFKVNDYGYAHLLALECIRNTNQPGGGRMDVVYVGVTLVFFALSWGLIALCERL
jgi:hypothetical protein